MSRSIDAWDDEPRRPTTSKASGLASTSGARLKTSAPVAVRDDWEMDDDEEEEEDIGRSVEDKNKQIWEEANTKEHHPMPALVISRGASSSVITPTLPLNQPPPMRILKRPSGSPSPASTSTSTPTGETLQEREARYQAARERIFGSGGAGVEGASENAENKKNLPSRRSGSQATSPTSISPTVAAATATTTTNVVRNPRGPSSTSSSGVVAGNGFAERKKTAPPTSATNFTASSTTTTPATAS